MKHRCRAFLSVLLCVLLCALLSVCSAPAAFGADAAFEKSIADFPESYRVKLRTLHEQHPDWEFNCVDTGLEWFDAVDTESSGGRSLVDISDSYAAAFKSKNTGDYNYSTSSYVQKDGGFCAANKFCVSFFMDPRNFLNEENVFQFEQLSFDDSFDVEAVDVVLSGTFMYQKKITYLTAEGESKTMNQTYAEVIRQAGESYDVNPCYLAAKIRNEIGSTPSGSVTGKNSTYPGIYNFYNIGATDGAGAITRGLAWAANTTAGTYQRPWDNPKKSILGGAEYIVNTYIGKGQFTGYYQRFNVNPESNYRTYNHQYMTNISGAAAQGYSSYRSYLSMGLLDSHFIFSLPVYRNMPGAENNTGTLTLADAGAQTAKVSTSAPVNVRTGPSTNYDKLEFTVAPGTELQVLCAQATDSHYYDSILRYPVWYQVKFNYNGAAYEGYLPAGFTTVTNTVTVAPGLYVPRYSSTNKRLAFRYVSMDARICSVVDDTKLNFLKEGSCFVLAYDSSGRYAMVKYTVSSAAPPNNTDENPLTLSGVGQVTGLQQTDVSETGFTLSWNALPDATGYRVFRYDASQGKYVSVKTTAKTAYTFTGLTAGSTLKLKVKAYAKANGSTEWGVASAAFAAKTVPPGPPALSQSESYTNSVTMSWSGVSGAVRYELERYDEAAKKFFTVQSTTDNMLSASALLPAVDYQFRVRAFVSIGGKEYATAYSETVTAKTGPEIVTGLKQTAATETALTLQWDKAPAANGYKVYAFHAQDGTLGLLGYTADTTFTVKNLSPGACALYVVKSYIKEDGIVYYSSVSEETMATTLPSKVTALRQFSTKSTCLKLQWTAVAGASGYCVYRVTASGGHKKLATVAANRALVENLKSGTRYTFAVRAFIRANGKVYWGAFSELLASLTNPAKTERLAVKAKKSASLVLTWKAVKGADCYYIYRLKNGKYRKIDETSKTVVTVAAASGTFAVRACIKENGAVYLGAFSDKVIVS